VRYAYAHSNGSNNGNIYTDSDSCCHAYGNGYSYSDAYRCWYSHADAHLRAERVPRADRLF
jgi:hypothetical protein